jgi:hypothetical protein
VKVAVILMTLVGIISSSCIAREDASRLEAGLLTQSIWEIRSADSTEVLLALATQDRLKRISCQQELCALLIWRADNVNTCAFLWDLKVLTELGCGNFFDVATDHGTVLVLERLGSHHVIRRWRNNLLESKWTPDGNLAEIALTKELATLSAGNGIVAIGADEEITVLDGKGLPQKNWPGRYPTISPDGTNVSFFDGKNLMILNVADGQVRTALRRGFWQSNFVGPAYWHPSQQLLAVSVSAGISGKETDCLILSVTEGQLRRLEGKTCGPWLEKT